MNTNQNLKFLTNLISISYHLLNNNLLHSIHTQSISIHQLLFQTLLLLLLLIFNILVSAVLSIKIREIYIKRKFNTFNHDKAKNNEKASLALDDF